MLVCQRSSLGEAAADVLNLYLVQICDKETMCVQALNKRRDGKNSFFKFRFLFAAQIFNKDKNVLPVKESLVQKCAA